jgi:transcription antitermination factor NusG
MKDRTNMTHDDFYPRRWYAVHLHSNFEALVSGLLSRTVEGEVFYPSYSVKSTRRGKEHLVRKPLFPGYIFVSTALSPANKVAILSSRGVAGIVKFGGVPAPIDDSVVHSLRILNEHKDKIAPHPYIREGTRVRVTSGPLAGARGIVLRTRGKKPKLVVSVDILQRSVGITIDPDLIEPDLS